MNAVLVVVFALLSTFSTFAAEGQSALQFPHSRSFLKKVTSELAEQIAKMDVGSFQNFSKDFSRDEFVRLIRSVEMLPEASRARLNSEGEEEGLLFDYANHFCRENVNCLTGPSAILVLRPFFTAYAALPMHQIEKEKSKADFYRMSVNEVRQGLLHEAAHLIGIGLEPGTEKLADEFAERFLAAMENQVVVCEYKDWRQSRANSQASEWRAMAIHRQTGNVAVVYATHDPNSAERTEELELAKKILRQLVANGHREGFRVSPFPEDSFFTLTPPKFKLSAESELSLEFKPIDGEADKPCISKLKANLAAASGEFEGCEADAGLQAWHPFHQEVRCYPENPSIEIQDLQAKK